MDRERMIEEFDHDCMAETTLDVYHSFAQRPDLWSVAEAEVANARASNFGI